MGCPSERGRAAGDWPEALAGISGAKNVFAEASQLEEYSEDMAGFRATPAVVVRPASEDEVRKIVALAGRRKVPIVPRGAGSSLTGAAVDEGRDNPRHAEDGRRAQGRHRELVRARPGGGHPRGPEQAPREGRLLLPSRPREQLALHGRRARSRRARGGCAA